MSRAIQILPIFAQRKWGGGSRHFCRLTEGFLRKNPSVSRAVYPERLLQAASRRAPATSAFVLRKNREELK